MRPLAGALRVKIHTVFISYNRLHLTKRAIESYLETVGDDFSYVVVDNASTDGAAQWFDHSQHPVILLNQNCYPGFAANVGWDIAFPEISLLHRADNDFEFLPGWRHEVEYLFAREPELGQLGLRTNEEEMRTTTNVGGNCVIRREMFGQGVRYDERPWPEFPPGYTEDSFFSPAVIAAGWYWRRVRRPCIVPISEESSDDDYYVQTWRDRRIYEYGQE